MKAFWWFEEGLIAGMARPGFNQIRWSEFPYEEALVMGWLGRFPSGAVSRESFDSYLDVAHSKVSKFFGLSEEQSRQLTDDLKTTEGIDRALDSVMKRIQVLESYQVGDEQVEIKYCKGRLQSEIESLKQRKIKRIVALTEEHHHRDELADHFDLHHFSIDDLHAPSFEQVQEVAQIIEETRSKGETLAVHCLAGIGRTSTVLIAAHMVLGRSSDELLELISERNPFYKCMDSQARFIDSVKNQIS